MDPKTKENLLTAMHGEAFAYVKYMLFAEQARKSGREDLAKLFEETAKVERFEHFAEEAELAGLVGSDVDNLRDSVGGESYEVTTMYKKFADEATAAGDKKAADRFLEVRDDEKGHLAAFEAELEKLAVGTK